MGKGTMGHFTTIFAPKTDNIVLRYATSECRRYPKLLAVPIGLALPSP